MGVNFAFSGGDFLTGCSWKGYPLSGDKTRRPSLRELGLVRLGKVKRKVLPRVSSLSARMEPPWAQHDVLGDGEAEAGASGFAGAGFVDAIEAFEEARQVLGGNAGAEIAHVEFDAAPRRRGRRVRCVRRSGRTSWRCRSDWRKPGGWLRGRPAPGQRFRGGAGVNLVFRVPTPWLRAISRKLSSASCNSSMGGTASVSKRVSPDSTRARVSRSSVRRDMRAAFLRMISRNSRVGPEFSEDVEQSFGVSLNRREWRAEFVGDVGDEIAAGFFDALGFGQVAEDGDGAAIGQGRGGDVEGAAGDDRGGAGGLHLFGRCGRFARRRENRDREWFRRREHSGACAEGQDGPWADWPTARGRRS